MILMIVTCGVMQKYVNRVLYNLISINVAKMSNSFQKSASTQARTSHPIFVTNLLLVESMMPLVPYFETMFLPRDRSDIFLVTAEQARGKDLVFALSLFLHASNW